MKITVTPAEEDEVIIAGAGAEFEPAPGADRGPGSESAPEPELESVSTQVTKAEKRSGPHHGSRGETTLEDLESSKMPAMQRAVIIAAIVCIIGAIIYYFVAMR